MEIAFGHLRLTPEVFWSMSLIEWEAAVDGYVESLGRGKSKPLSRRELEDLMARYPDEPPPDPPPETAGAAP